MVIPCPISAVNNKAFAPPRRSEQIISIPNGRDKHWHIGRLAHYLVNNVGIYSNGEWLLNFNCLLSTFSGANKSLAH